MMEAFELLWDEVQSQMQLPDLEKQHNMNVYSPVVKDIYDKNNLIGQ